MGNHASGKVKSKGNDKGTSLLFERIERAKQSVGNGDVNRPLQEIKTLDAKRVNDCDCSNNDSSFSSSSSSSSQIVSSTNDSSTVDSKTTVESSKISNRSDTNDNSLLRGSLLSLATDDSSITGRNNSNITDDSDLGDDSTMMSSMLLNGIGTCESMNTDEGIGGLENQSSRTFAPKNLVSWICSSNGICSNEGKWIEQYIEPNVKQTILPTLSPTTSNFKEKDRLVTLNDTSSYESTFIYDVSDSWDGKGSCDDSCDSLSLHRLIENNMWLEAKKLLLTEDAMSSNVNMINKSIEVQNERKQTPLCVACMNPEVPYELLQLLLAFFPKAISTADENGNLPIHLWCQVGLTSRNEVSYDLSQSKLSFDSIKSISFNSRHSEKEYQKQLCQKLSLLLKYCRQASLVHMNKEGNTALHLAIQRGHAFDFIRLLLEACPASASIRNKLDRYPLHYIGLSVTSVETVQAILDANNEAVKTVDCEGSTPLSIAVGNYCCEENMKLLLESYPDACMIENDQAETPIDIIFKMLLREYFNNTTQDDHTLDNANLSSFIINDSCDKYWSIVELLLRGAHDSYCKQKGRTKWRILHAAVTVLNLDLIRLVLFIHKDQLTEMDENGDLPLHVLLSTSRNCDKRKVDTVIDDIVSANPSAVKVLNKKGRLPLELALINFKCTSNGVKTLINAEPRSAEHFDLNTKLYPFMLAASSKLPKYRSKDIGRNQVIELLSIIYILLRCAPKLVEKVVFSDEDDEDIEKRNLRKQSYNLWVKNCSLSKTLKAKSLDLAKAYQESEDKLDQQTARIAELNAQVSHLKQDIAEMDNVYKDSIAKLLYQNAKLDKMVTLQNKKKSATEVVQTSAPEKASPRKKSYMKRKK